MKRILMRAGMPSWDNFNPYEVLTENLIGNNIGNMLFPYSIARTLTLPKTKLDTIVPERVKTKEEIDFINKNYDVFVLPFANAFRVSFIKQLEATTKVIEKVNIPCVVTGVGMQKNIGQKTSNEKLDKAVKNFMIAVLNKSALVGVRGEATADYLKGLGFIPEKEFTVIGCPSMYMHGKNLPKIESPILTPDSKVSLNSKIALPQVFHNVLYRISKEYRNYHYVPQVIEEIARMYAGVPYPKNFVKGTPKYFPMKASNAIYKNKKGLSFVNVPSWLSYLKEKDVSVGSRIHGNIAGILAGTPAFVIVSDMRILELVEYHNIPHMLINDLKETDTLETLMERADFSRLQEGHEERFMHYLDFLKANRIDTIYDENGTETSCTFDEKIKDVQWEGPLYAYTSLSMGEQVKRIEQFMGRYRYGKR